MRNALQHRKKWDTLSFDEAGSQLPQMTPQSECDRAGREHRRALARRKPFLLHLLERLDALTGGDHIDRHVETAVREQL
jgi:hypothetical protein